MKPGEFRLGASWSPGNISPAPSTGNTWVVVLLRCDPASYSTGFALSMSENKAYFFNYNSNAWFAS